MKAKEELPYYFEEASECELVQGSPHDMQPAAIPRVS
jgi:hypothetical protein